MCFFVRIYVFFCAYIRVLLCVYTCSFAYLYALSFLVTESFDHSLYHTDLCLCTRIHICTHVFSLYVYIYIYRRPYACRCVYIARVPCMGVGMYLHDTGVCLLDIRVCLNDIWQRAALIPRTDHEGIIPNHIPRPADLERSHQPVA